MTKNYNIKKVIKSKSGQYNIEFENKFARDFDSKFYWEMAKTVFYLGFSVGLIMFFARWVNENYEIKKVLNGTEQGCQIRLQ